VGGLFLTEDCTEGQLGAYALALPNRYYNREVNKK
jgi:hypothetical protein